MKSVEQIINHIDEIIQNELPDTAGTAVIVEMTNLIDWIGDCENSLKLMEDRGDNRETE